MKKKKNLLISSFHPFVSRNILQTDVFRLLKENEEWGCIIILCPKHKEAYFKKAFEHGKVIVLGITLLPLSKSETRWKELGNALLRTSTIRNNRKERMERDHKLFSYIIFILIQFVIARFTLLRKIYQRLSLSIFVQSTYLDLLNLYDPVVFSTDIFHDEDVRLLTSAKKLKLKTIGMVRSWDNCTNKGILPVVPDIGIAHNNIIAQELVSFHGASMDNIKIVGIPQFDYYNHYRSEDDSFFTRTGFSKDHKIILFAPTGSKFVDDDWFILDILIKAIADGRISNSPQILVRFPPGDYMKIEKSLGDSEVKIYIDKPGVSFSENYLKDREMSKEDMKWLAESLYWSDLLVSVGSTLCIDIAVFDKPIIMPCLEVQGIPYSRSMRKIYNKYHLKHLLDIGACEITADEVSFIDKIKESLLNPGKRRVERQNLVTEQTFLSDGRSSNRLADIINA